MISAARIDIDVPVSRVLERHDLDGARTRPITSEQLVTRTAQKALTGLAIVP
jgi:CubicO group peptidase (beta-lactamase class C family)